MSEDDDTSIAADLAVIGFGKGAKTLAATLGRKGKRVVMIEQSAQMYGGTCINIGCVPTKSLVYQAEQLSERNPAAYRRAVENELALTAKLRADNFAMLDGIESVSVLTGRAELVDPHTVKVTLVDGGGTVVVSAEHLVVSTGSEPRIPDVPGLADSGVMVTSTDLLATPELPRRLVVLGGGYVGLEFAAMYAAYGSEVTVLERHSEILGQEDDDVAACARDLLRENGVTVVTDAEVRDVGTDGDAPATVTYQRHGALESVYADVILAAAGRRPVTDGLGLDAAGIDLTDAGAVAVDDHLRTSQPHVFAMGDVNGGPQFTYVSLDDYRIVLDQLAGSGTRSTTDRRAVPYTLFMTPPLARVGLTERDARAAGRRVRVAALPVASMATVPRARIVDEARGMMKVVVDADDDVILGAALLSYDSHEVINVVSLAMRHGITATQLRDEIYTHPSMTEAFNQLLGALA
ncbi:pyridine nucleotide-disulfide oxidoreductase [Mycobacterium hodleri]|uniref:Pyridine nucleotide-disulfide oxidoreductase n=1 Tax=Mycolicibacterium hodleri TaxID=49897 RepID=A0A544VYT4_9MYCO|nr:FAD-dependent oxidoreductase [Mycolicibacterium hodleri]TQR85148.1 pyridine nucleotide-disulfide oxidoreductase [Mycolicibacterium hodleri]